MPHDSPDVPNSPIEWFPGGGEMAERVRRHDWASTPLGDVETWPQSLKTAVRIILGSRYPMFVWWGREMTNFYNDAYAPILGRRHPDALGRSAFDVWTDIWDVVGPLAEAVLNKGQSSWNEDLLLVMERNGYPEETYFTFSYSPVANDEGGPGGVFCACTEETSRVLGARRLRTLRDLAEATAKATTAEEACRLSAEALAANPYDLPFGLVYLFDGDGRGRLAGVAGLAEGAPGAPRDISSTTDKSDSWPLELVAERGTAVMLTDVTSRFGPLASGPWPETPHTAYLAPITQAGGGPPAGVLVAGVSARREFDDDYRGFLDLAAGHVATALASATAYEKERRRAETLAELDRAKTAFFSNVSHEFRTPLTLMLGPLEDAVTSPPGRIPDEERERLAVARRNGDRLLRLVNTLLDFSRIEAGRIDAVYEPVDLAALTADLASVFRSAIEKAGLRLVVDAPPLGEAVYVDREMWEKIVFNLLSNALKFTFEGEIEVSLRRRDGAAELAVRDTGTGIPGEELPRIFERFHRVKNARGRTFEGSGIGLALVRELAKLHGGSVDVESEPGRGSTFRVAIPLGRRHLPAERVGAARTLASTGVRGEAYVEEALSWLPDTSRDASPADGVRVLQRREPGDTGVSSPDLGPAAARVLVADDNADMRDYIRRLLSATYDVIVAPDGDAAIEAAREHPPDLVLSDVMMPKLDGFGLLAALRADERTAAVPVIMLSARAGEESRIEGYEAGADDYLVKPFSARELLARVEAHIEIARVRRESERRFKTVADTAPAILWITEPDGSCSFLSRGWYEFTGQTERDALGSGWLEAVHPDDRERSGRVFLEANEKREPFELDYRLRRVDGEYRWAIDAARPRFGPDGEYLGFVGSVIDVHERKRAEEALRESRDVLTLAMRGGRMGAWSRNLATNRVWWSRELEEIFGLAPGQFHGTEGDFFAFVHKDDREMLARAVEEAIQRRDDYAVEFRFLHASGQERWMDGRGRAVYDSDGRPTMLYGLGIDITARKQVEREREQLLAREQEAGRAKDEFLAVVSHELRTPLNSMLGWVRLLRSGTLDKATAERAVATIERNTLAQAQLIDDLLDVSRIVSGKLRIKVEKVDLNSVVSNAVEAMRLAAGAKEIRLSTVLDSNTGTVVGDPDRLQQVVWNLVSNAVKFTPRGGKVQVHLRRVDSHVEIGVADTGLGIDAGFLPHVFERFAQADASSKRPYGGLGLGLAIARHLVELHGGTIEVQSEGKDRGATFFVRLPLSIALTSETVMGRAQAAEYDAVPIACPPTLSGLRVLVVDDEPDTRTLLTLLLEQCGATVKAASSAAEALDALAVEAPDVLVSDVGMPEMDGYDLVARVREGDQERGRYLPSVALTAYARTEDRVRLLAAGFDAHLPKPVEPAELRMVIERLARRT